MRGRRPDEAKRASTPLELLFDLCFVVAVSQAAGQLHHSLQTDRLAHGLVSYLMVFFAIWWAWMNFTWFASAYDTDDVLYRLLTLLQIAGVLILAAGVPAAFDSQSYTAITVGYVVMRIAMVAQWFRAGRDSKDGNRIPYRYAAGVTIVQAGWVGRLLFSSKLATLSFLILVVAEISVPLWAERGGRTIRWHPGHIEDRYGCFTLIVLGECVAAATVAVQSATSSHGLPTSLLVVAGGGLLLVFGLWWSYFQRSAEASLATSGRQAFVWGYTQYFIFASIAALGAALQVVTDRSVHTGPLSLTGAAFAVAIPVAVYLSLISVLQARLSEEPNVPGWMTVTAVAVVVAAAASASVVGLPAAIALMGAAVSALVGLDVARMARR